MTTADAITLRPWPLPVLSEDECARLRARLHAPFLDLIRQCRIDISRFDDFCRVYLPLAAWAARVKGSQPLILGISGAQGSGKSTLTAFLSLALQQAFGMRVAQFSIDDFYLTRPERAILARKVHPLLITRGVPGTHDVALGLTLLDALNSAGRGDVISIPAFDKGLDDRRPVAEWPKFRGPADIILFEGWCVGAKPQAQAALGEAVNRLESQEDPDGVWRQFVNTQLEEVYPAWFGRVNRLVMLTVPGMRSVYEWRRLQEWKLAESRHPDDPAQIMDAPQLERFVMHYERLTRHMLQEMPQRADIVLNLDTNHRFTHIGVNTPS